MKIAIISDIHDNLINLAKTINWCQKENIEAVICCGDITNSETLEFLATEFYKNIYLARGNAEIYDEAEIKKYDNINYLGEFGRISLENRRIGICHKPEHINEILDSGPCDIIFYGHTHLPAQEKRGETTIVNAGTVAGTFSKACFTVWETTSGKLDLMLLELIK